MQPPTRPRRRAVLTAALAATAAAAGCSVPEPRRSAPTADPAPGKPIDPARARRALLMQFAAHPDDDLYFMNPDSQRLFDAGVP
ncbi:PIG-L family deacetylase, partial [Streptomyces sp. NPDC006324]